MHPIFSISRFGWLFRKHWAEHARAYLMSVAVLAGFMSVVLAFHFINRAPIGDDEQLTIFTGFLFLAGLIFTSNAFIELGENKKTIAYLMLPATHGEKFSVKWVFTIVIFGLVYITVYYAVMGFFWQIFNGYQHKTNLVNIFTEKQMPVVGLIFLSFQAVYLWGSVYFKKLHFIRTSFLIIVGYVVLLFVNQIIFKGMTGLDKVFATPFNDVPFTSGKDYYVIEPPENYKYIPRYAFLILPFIFWSAAFYRLKEKQV